MWRKEVGEGTVVRWDSWLLVIPIEEGYQELLGSSNVSSIVPPLVLCPILCSVGHLLPVEDSLDLLCYSGGVVRITAYCLDRWDRVHTDSLQSLHCPHHVDPAAYPSQWIQTVSQSTLHFWRTIFWCSVLKPTEGVHLCWRCNCEDFLQDTYISHVVVLCLYTPPSADVNSLSRYLLACGHTKSFRYLHFMKQDYRTTQHSVGSRAVKW